VAGYFEISNELYRGTFYIYNPQFQVSKHFQNFLGEEFAVQVEYNRRQRASLSTSSSILDIFVSPRLCRILTLRSMYNLLINILLAGPYRHDLHSFGPIYTVRCLLPVDKPSTQFIIQVQILF